MQNCENTHKSKITISYNKHIHVIITYINCYFLILFTKFTTSIQSFIVVIIWSLNVYILAHENFMSLYTLHKIKSNFYVSTNASQNININTLTIYYTKI